MSAFADSQVNKRKSCPYQKEADFCSARPLSDEGLELKTPASQSSCTDQSTLSTQPEETADIWRCYQCFPHQMTSEKQAQICVVLLRSTSDWSCCMGNFIQPIKSTTQIWVVMHHQYGISALVSQTSFGGGTSGSVAKCWLFSQATINLVLKKPNLCNPHQHKRTLY